jgi:hypothetical protein
MTYATRKRVHVDRCASAWLILRYLDPEAKFVFVEEDEVPPGAVPFGMDGVKWGRQGNRCTFEVLLSLYNLTDPALQQLAAIIHGAETAADFTSTLESPGIDLAFRGLRLVSVSDSEAIARGCLLMDGLYAAIRDGYLK